MCGIFGTVQHRISREQFEQQLHLISHRGPDGYGIWEHEEAQVKLGHRRLAIIDTDSRSNQPMTFDNRYIIVFNGEIYNYIELRQELQMKGISFVTASDSEVLLKLMVAEGPEALSKLNGMWAFVIYDAQERSLFMSRDRVGKKPLYYIHEQQQFAFGSEMKCLYGCLNELSYNQPFIDYALANPFDNEILPETIIHKILKFPAGSYGIFRNGALTINRYYHPEQLLEQTPSFKNFEEATEQFRALFESSCRLRMRSDVPVGSALSGGIDSGFVVSTLAKLGYGKQGDYSALICSFPGSYLDESVQAKQVAAHAGVPAIQVEVDADLNPHQILQTVYEFEEFYLTSPITLFQSYKGFRKNGIVVTLDGHGGDELFGGYPFDLEAKLRDDFPNPVSMYQTFKAMHQMYNRPNPALIKDTFNAYKRELRKRLSGTHTSFFKNQHYYRQQLFHSTFKGILPTLLRNFDKYSMHAGVEVRMPFLDYRLIAFAFTLPNHYKLRNGYSKAIVREAAKPVVPASVLATKLKSGWNSPMSDWMTGVWKEWLLDETSSTAFINCELIDGPSVARKLNDYYDSGYYDHTTAQQLWLQLQPYLVQKANQQFARIPVNV